MRDDDRSFLYGDGLFETVRVMAPGTVRWLDRHCERLRRSGAALGFPESHIERGVDALRAVVEREPGLWRVTVSRPGEGAPFGGSGRIDTRFRPFSQPARPNLGLAEDFYLPDDFLAEHKTTSYQRYIEARRLALANGFEDALLTSRDGLVGEATTANIVAVVDGSPVTPPVRGILDGVTRRGVLELAEARDEPVEVREMSVEELRRADEIALLSAGVGVLAAASLEGRALDDAWSRRAGRWLEEIS